MLYHETEIKRAGKVLSVKNVISFKLRGHATYRFADAKCCLEIIAPVFVLILVLL